MEIRNIPIGQLLLEDGSITQEQLNEALEYKNTHTDMRVGEILETLGFITSEERLIQQVMYMMLYRQ